MRRGEGGAPCDGPIDGNVLVVDSVCAELFPLDGEKLTRVDATMRKMGVMMRARAVVVIRRPVFTKVKCTTKHGGFSCENVILEPCYHTEPTV